MIDPEVIAAVLCMSVSLFIIAPAMGLFVWRYVVQKDNTCIRQRHFSLIIVMESLLVLLCVVERPLAFIIFTGNVTSQTSILSDIDAVLWSICFIGIVILMCWRFWTFYYDVSIYQNNATRAWTEIINPISDTTRNFVLEHMSTYGSIRWCSTRLFLIFLILAALQAIFHILLSLQAANAYTAFICLVGMAIIIQIRRKTPAKKDFVDVFFIRQELNHCYYLGLVTTILAFPVFIVNVIADWWLLQAALSVIALIAAFLLSMIQTAYVLYRCHLTNISWIPLEMDSDREQKRTQFRDCMKRRDDFDLFVAHLQREFSLENLVACLEMYQMAKTLVPLVDPQRQTLFYKSHDMSFYDYSPRSHIVDGDYTLELKMLLLHEKYVSSRSHFELNLPSALKDEWRTYCETIKSDFGVAGFDDIVKTLYYNSPGEVSPGITTAGSPGGQLAEVEVPQVDEHGYVQDDESEIVEPQDKEQVLLPSQSLVYLHEKSSSTKNLDPKRPVKIKSSQVPLFKSDNTRAQYYKQVLDLCDKVVRECYGLMSDSYSRFNLNEMRQIRSKTLVNDKI